MDKVDVHHHYIAPDFLEAWSKTSLSKYVTLPSWTPELSLAFMSDNGIGQAVLSPALGPSFVCTSTEATSKLTRQMNAYAATLCEQHPSRFAFFATLSDPRDTELMTTELTHAYEELGACGVALFTSYDGLYLGDPAFINLWAELDRRAAVVFVHPGLDFGDRVIREPSLIARPLVDWTHETTRTASHLILSDTMRKYPNCKIILPHGGGTLPYVIGRLSNLSAMRGIAGKSADEVRKEARLFYYDVAVSGFNEPLDLLQKFTAPGHLLYGSDFPYLRDEELYKSQIETIQKVATETREEILHEASRRLFPNLAKQ